MALPKREETVQGFEKQFGVNHIGHFTLTNLLLPKIKAANEGRIVNLSSIAHETGKMNFDDINHKKNYKMWPVYMQSKLANVYFTKHFAKLLKDEKVKNVKVCSLHPGVVRTELGRYMFESKIMEAIFMILAGPFLYLGSKSPWEGTQTSLHCCLMPFDELESGAYYSDCKVKKEKIPEKWEAEAAKLWELSEQAVKQFL